jgi:dTDP-4-amino-4,6-dideoxygalactose transaminase
MEIFHEEVALRNEVARRYSDLLSSEPSLGAPSVPEGRGSVFAQYSILAQSGAHRLEIQARLREEAIPTAIYYPKPLHMQEAFAPLGYKKGDFPVSEDFASRIFSIPMHPYLEAGDQERIVGALRG